MKNLSAKFRITLISIVVHLLISSLAIAQALQKMSYQAVIRNSINQLVTSQKVGMQISILQGSATGTVVYTETQTPSTNTNGLVSIEIGGATGFNAIDWSTGSYFIKTETDPTGGTNYTITGTSQLLSVPYALYAKTAGNSVAGPKGDKGDPGTISLKVTATGDTLYLSPSQFVIIPGVSAANKPVSTNTVTDKDGNTYNTVTIGTQTWMAANLKVTQYNDGTSIPNVTDATTWSNLTTGAQCDYNNTPANTTIYGKLYNWYSVNSGMLCPTGWHVPSDADWATLSTTLGGDAVSGGILKEIGTTHWISPNTGATDTRGFTALPGGGRGSTGMCNYIGDIGAWCSSTEQSTSTVSSWYMGSSYSNLKEYTNSKVSGFSVRCLSN
jgi:uncharacterized protein (TIGR02145 family)